MGSRETPLENRHAQAKRVGRPYLERPCEAAGKEWLGITENTGHSSYLLRKVSRRVFPFLSTAINLQFGLQSHLMRVAGIDESELCIAPLSCWGASAGV